MRHNPKASLIRVGLACGVVVALGGPAAHGQSVRLVAIQGDVVAPDLRIQGNVGAPSINALGKVAFMAVQSRGVTSGLTGLVSDSGGTLACVARDGSPAFPGPLAFSTLSMTTPFVFGDDGVLGLAQPLVSGSGTVDSVWYGPVSDFAEFARTGGDAPCDFTATYDNGLPTGRVAVSHSRNGRTVMRFGLRDSADGVQYNALFSDGTGDWGLHSIASPDGFVGYGTPLINDAGTVCVRANFELNGLQTGVFIGPVGDLEGVATTVDIAPDEDANWLPGSPMFTAFGSISIHNDGFQWVVFNANLSDGRSGIFLMTDDTALHLVTMTGRQVQGLPAGVTFTALGQPLVCTGEDVLFMGQFAGPGVNSSNNVALFRFRDPDIEILGRCGQTVRGATGPISFTLTTPFSANAAGQAAFVGTIQPGGTQVLLATDAGTNMVAVYQAGLQMTLRPGMVRTLTGLSPLYQSGDGNGRAASLNAAGDIAFAATANIPAGQPSGASGPCVVVMRIPPVRICGSADFNNDGDASTDADIEAFFACIAGSCCPTCDPHGADFDGDGDAATDADIEAFFRVLAGGSC